MNAFRHLIGPATSGMAAALTYELIQELPSMIFVALLWALLAYV